MKITELWPTIISQGRTELPTGHREKFINLLYNLDEEERRLNQITVFQQYDHIPGKRRNANLFRRFGELDFIDNFERVAVTLYREYMRDAGKIADATTVSLTGNCHANVQMPGERTVPHYHHGLDGVLVHYLDVGAETQPPDSPTGRHGTGATLLLQDPRPSPNFPWWNKIHRIEPYNGLTLIHPAYLWHETHTWQGPGRRACLVVNFRITTPKDISDQWRFKY